jgi:AraC-like DNA-binding protein
MDTLSDILSVALGKKHILNQLSRAFEEKQDLGNGMELFFQKLEIPEDLELADTAMVVYYPKKGRSAGNSIELKYCLSGNRYCPLNSCRGTLCSDHLVKDCLESRLAADIITISVSPAFFKNFHPDSQLSFNHIKNLRQPLLKIVPVSGKARVLLQQVLHHSYEGLWEKIYLQSKSLELLLYSAESFEQQSPETVTCRFLSNPGDREKVMLAKEIMLADLENPLTIRELSRKVAMNECYLKKGFKEIFGTTIYDYFQKERMERAKYLLYDKGLSVSEVARLMGYSSLSHFSTAFKKHTGIKPCELLR